MLTEERIQYQDDFFLRKCSKYSRIFWMPHEWVAKCPLGGQSTTRSSWSLEPNPLLFRLGLGLADGPQLASIS